MKDPKNSTNPIHQSYAEPNLIRNVSTSEAYKRYIENRMNWDFEPRIFAINALSGGPISALSCLRCFNYCTYGYLDCINVVDGTVNHNVSDETFRFMEEHISDALDFTNRLVYRLNIKQLTRLHPIILLAINDIYGRYGEKGFNDKYAVELKERLSSVAENLKTCEWESKFPNASEEVKQLFTFLTSET